MKLLKEDPKDKVMSALHMKKRSPWKSKAGMVGGALAGAAGTYGASKAASKLGNGLAKGLDKGRSAVTKGEEAAEKIQDVGDKVSSVTDAVSAPATGVGKAFAAVKALGGSDSDSEWTADTKLRHIIQEFTTVAVTRPAAYNQWTQFEDFPKIFKAVVSVEQEEDDVLKWAAKIGPSKREWTAEIVEQVPDRRIAWETTGGAVHSGVVSFHSLDDELTRVLVEMEYHPQGFMEKTANLLRIQRRRVRRELKLFKHLLEPRKDETGEWRGEVDKKQEEGPKQGEELKESVSKAEEERDKQQDQQEKQSSDQKKDQPEQKQSADEKKKESVES